MTSCECISLWHNNNHPKIFHPTSATICLVLCTLNSHTQQRGRRVLCQQSALQPSSAVCLFIPFISLHPAIPFFPQSNRWLHEGVPGFTLAHVFSKLPTLRGLHCLLSKVTKGKSWDVLTPRECVCLCWQSSRKEDIWENSCALRTRSCVYACGSRYSYTKFTLLSWESVRNCSCAALCVLYTLWFRANYRNRQAKFKSLLKTDHISLRLPWVPANVTNKSEVDMKQSGGSTCIRRCVARH